MGAGLPHRAVRVDADTGGDPLGVVVDDPVVPVHLKAVLRGRPHRPENEDSALPVLQKVPHDALVGCGEGDGAAQVVLEALREAGYLGQVVAVFAVEGNVALLILPGKEFLPVPVRVNGDLALLLRLLRLLRLPFGAGGKDENGQERAETERFFQQYLHRRTPPVRLPLRHASLLPTGGFCFIIHKFRA